MAEINKKRISGFTKLYALLGYPAKHSLSPFIHNYFFSKYNIDSIYLSFEVIPNNFKNAFLGALSLGLYGVNLTMPFKEESLKYINEIDEDVKYIKAANTIIFDNEKEIIKGFNTDINGFIKSLDDKFFKWKNSNCLIVGAGGVAKSVAYGLLKKDVKSIFIYNRTTKRAYGIKSLFKDIENNKLIVIDDINNVPINEINLIINCTSIGMKLENYKNNNNNDDNLNNNSNEFSNSLPIPINWNLKNKFIFEMVYNPTNTALVKKSINDGAKIIFGTEMLLNQAAFSFKIWNGIFPDLRYLKKYFKNSFN